MHAPFRDDRGAVHMVDQHGEFADERTGFDRLAARPIANSGTRTASPDTIRYAPSPGVPALVMMLPRRKADAFGLARDLGQLQRLQAAEQGHAQQGAMTLSIAMASNLIDADFCAALGDSRRRVQSRCGQAMRQRPDNARLRATIVVER